eukprot:CAMPEP_0172437070 /NCGR_PEP_ID=MMETSP1064-20121228/72058_1 /TAXON_ID=202472 /ORGANISM="Aulacoseira subarctica , Strain CCAP 1002/5" /LENGTH=270 /DNA_ID=CAMNT_0013185513 /DNA_START=26 /DNA_END=838 /DNA_ORIENTATION=-
MATDENDNLLVSDYETCTGAEDKKELGNQAFASKDYKTAISYYTEAIDLDPKNHIYFSNRSACHVALEQWTEAAADAKKCLMLCPQFVKAYYRLSLAQMELGQLDAAQSTIKLGLNLDPNSTQLSKQLRAINAKKKASKKEPLPVAISGASAVDSEIVDLQNQFRSTLRDYNVSKSNLDKYQRDQKISEFTKAELQRLSSSSESNMYRGIGKMFLLSSQEDVLTHLDEEIAAAQKKEVEMSAKLEYLDKRMKSQQQNIAELAKSLPTFAA